MVKVAFDAGHGIYTPGKRTPDGEREWTFNNKVVLAAIAKLNTYDNVQILRLDDPTGNNDVPLITRTNKANAWGADVLVSAHHNALAGVWGSHGGVETFVHPTGSRASYDIADTVQPRITKAMGLRDRGVKQYNLHMIRESNMPAILTEGGFMDSTTDIGALRSDAKLKAQGVAIAEGLAVYYNLKPKTGSAGKPAPSPTKSVASGTYTVKKGDTLSAIAGKNNTTVAILQKDNGIKDANLIKVGQVLKFGAQKAPAKSVSVSTSKVVAKPKEILVVDGYLGKATYSALQRYFGTYVDGIISRPSPVVKALQKLLGVTQDGYWGADTNRALQRRFGTYVDGVISRPSPVIKELQRRLNKGKL